MNTGHVHFYYQSSFNLSPYLTVKNRGMSENLCSKHWLKPLVYKEQSVFAKQTQHQFSNSITSSTKQMKPLTKKNKHCLFLQNRVF